MAAPRTSRRAHAQVDYNERGGGGGGGPAWARELAGGAKENARPASAGAGAKRGAGAGPAPPPAKPARKSAPAVAQKGRNAGLERLPIGAGPGGPPPPVPPAAVAG